MAALSEICAFLVGKTEKRHITYSTVQSVLYLDRGVRGVDGLNYITGSLTAHGQCTRRLPRRREHCGVLPLLQPHHDHDRRAATHLTRNSERRRRTFHHNNRIQIAIARYKCVADRRRAPYRSAFSTIPATEVNRRQLVIDIAFMCAV